MKHRLSEPEAFWSKVQAVVDGCWNWTATLNRKGYGQFRRRGNAIAHRYAYEAMVGPVPDGLELDHLCRNRRCVRPDHLEPVTHQENVKRGMRATQTHCKRGHEFTDANTYTQPSRAGRICRACRALKRIPYRDWTEAQRQAWREARNSARRAYRARQISA